MLTTEEKKEKVRISNKKYRETHQAEIVSYRENNREKFRVSNRKYYKKNQEKLRKDQQRRRGEDPEKYRLKMKKWEEEHPKRRKLHRKNYRDRHPEKVKEAKRKWIEEHPEKVRLDKRALNYKSKYNMTMSEYNSLYDKQGGVCAICKTPQSKLKRYLAIDHNHKTGRIRGLLCVKCNLGLGNFCDTITILEKAIKYLKNNNE